MRAMANQAAGGWIVCLRAERPVIRGSIRCPLSGSFDLRHCLDCHFLETLATERRADRECEARPRRSVSS